MIELSKAIDDNDLWFGSDVGQFFNSKLAMLDEKSFDYVGFLDLDDAMNKRTYQFCESLMTHAMVYVGYNTDIYGSLNYWKIENSWGGQQGLIRESLVVTNGSGVYLSIDYSQVYIREEKKSGQVILKNPSLFGTQWVLSRCECINIFILTNLKMSNLNIVYHFKIINNVCTKKNP